MWLELAQLGLNAYSQYAGGKSRDNSARYEAAQLEQRAGQLRAASQRSARDERRRAALLSSALQARAGGGASDPTIVKLAADIAGEGEYRAMSALYHGEDQAVGDEMSAASRRYAGADAARAGRIGASASILEGGYSMYKKYGGGTNTDGNPAKR
jgi:hypothetical protein